MASSNQEIKSTNSRRRIILYLIEKYLNDNGHTNLAGQLKNDSLLQDYEICDNIDLDSIFLEYCSYYNLKFGKYPKILKKTEFNPLTESVKSEKKSLSNKSKKSKTANSICENAEFDIQVRHIFFSENDPKETLLAVENMKKYEIPSEWNDLAEIVHGTSIKSDNGFKWKDIIGNNEAVSLIKEAVLLPLEHPEMFSEKIKPWKSILMHGPPGCGKTLIAKTLCSEIQDSVTFFNITASTVMSKWRGDSEKLINVLFKIAKMHKPAIIFFDEIESLTSKRDECLEHEASKRFKNEFLTLMDGLETNNDGLFILANSNLPWRIDEAFLRRFEKKVLLKLPNLEERKSMLTYFLPELINWKNDVLYQLAEKCHGLTGDEIRILCKEAKMTQLRNISTSKKKSLTEFDFVNAISSLSSTTEGLMKKHENWSMKKNA